MIATEVSVNGGRVVLQVWDEAGKPWWVDLNPTDAADLAHRLLHAATEAEHGA